MITKVNVFKENNQWIWAFLGAILIWLIMGLTTSRLNMESLYSNGISAAFLAIAAIGQMLVITSGRGAIDLSIPGVITLSAYLATGIINGSDVNLFQGLVIVLLVGAVIGLLNSLAIIYLKIPPMIATLAMGYVLTTASLVYNQGFAAFKICPVLIALTRNRFLTVPLIILFVCIVGLITAFVLNRTTYGRSLTAIGQNIEAAHLTGIGVTKTLISTYIISSILAGLAGILISARVGGAFLGMGDSYLLETVGSVVIGGTLISGGKATVLGTFFGCLFLVLLVTAMQVAGLPIGIQNMIKGALIIFVLLLATETVKEG